eukprot:scaffold135519_cov81-Cyclotella_meneghiniana.AAC.2
MSTMTTLSFRISNAQSQQSRLIRSSCGYHLADRGPYRLVLTIVILAMHNHSSPDYEDHID